MAFNGSGVFNRIHSWATDLINTVPVTASRMDSEMDGMATGLSNTICRDGQSTTTARIPFASGVSAAAGSISAASYAQTNDIDTGMYFPAADQIGFTCAGGQVLALTATGATITGTLAPSGQIVGSAGTVAAPGISFASDLDCGLYRIGANNIGAAVNGAKVLDIGTAGLGVTGTLTSSGALTVSAGGAAITGNSSVTGTLTSSSTLTVSAGGAAITGATAITGAATISSTLNVAGNFSVETTKFTVNASTGNTAVLGTLAVTGALTANAAAGVTAKNTVKAFGSVVNAALVGASFNVASVVDNGTTHTVNFSTAMAGTTYTVVLTRDLANNPADTVVILGYTTRNAADFTIAAQTTGGAGSDPDSYSFIVLEG